MKVRAGDELAEDGGMKCGFDTSSHSNMWRWWGEVKQLQGTTSITFFVCCISLSLFFSS